MSESITSRFLVAILGVFMAASARAAIKTELVEYKHGDTVLQGFLAWDDAVQGARPGVLVVHEWWGLTRHVKGECEKLAAQGYIAFAADMYGRGVVADRPDRASQLMGQLMSNPTSMRELAGLGLKVLTGNKLCDARRVAAIGFCMGGTVCLELARTGAELVAVVGFHTSGISAKTPGDNRQIKGRVLICNGADDTFISADEKQRFHQQMRDAKIDYQMIEYGGALHAFTNPDADGYKVEGVKYDAKADQRSWQHMLDLFREAFAK